MGEGCCLRTGPTCGTWGPLATARAWCSGRGWLTACMGVLVGMAHIILVMHVKLCRSEKLRSKLFG